MPSSVHSRVAYISKKHWNYFFQNHVNKLGMPSIIRNGWKLEAMVFCYAFMPNVKNSVHGSRSVNCFCVMVPIGALVSSLNHFYYTSFLTYLLWYSSTILGTNGLNSADVPLSNKQKNFTRSNNTFCFVSYVPVTMMLARLFASII